VNEVIFKQRTKDLALNIIKLIGKFPRGRVAYVIGRQLLRSATSIGANYRAACRAKSIADIIANADIIAKLSIVEEEADESIYWMELLIESGIIDKNLLQTVMAKTDEITAMTVAPIKTLRKRKEREC